MQTVSVPLSEIGLSAEDYMLKCRLDPKTFSREFFKTHPHYQSKPFQHQKDLLDLIDHNPFLSVQTSRDVGTTSTLASYIAWQMTCSPHNTIAYMSNCKDKSQHLMDLVEQFINNDTRWPITCKRSTRNKLDSSSGSHFTSGSYMDLCQFRGMTITTLIIERGYGYEDEWSEKISAIMPAIPIGKANVIEIMPIHAQSLFENSYTCKIPWTVMPHHTEKLKQEIIANIGFERWVIEYGD